jgi:hypothetical protein
MMVTHNKFRTVVAIAAFTIIGFGSVFVDGGKLLKVFILAG